MPEATKPAPKAEEPKFRSWLHHASKGSKLFEDQAEYNKALKEGWVPHLRNLEGHPKFEKDWAKKEQAQMSADVAKQLTDAEATVADQQAEIATLKKKLAELEKGKAK